jgi:hypothetical protein
METSAALWYLRKIMEGSVETQTIGEADQRLMQLLMGSKSDTDILPGFFEGGWLPLPRATRVMVLAIGDRTRSHGSWCS